MFKGISWLFFWRTTNSAPSSHNISPIAPTDSSDNKPQTATALMDDFIDASLEKEEPSVRNTDALDRFLKGIAKLKNDLPKMINEWEKLGEVIIEENTELREYNIHIAEKNNEILHAVKENKSYFANFIEILKQDMEPADLELHQQLQTTHDHVQQLFAFLENGCNDVEDTTKTDQEKRKRCLDMQHISIQLLKELQDTSEKIESELNYCLMFEEITASVVWRSLRFFIFAHSGLSIPEFDIGCKTGYRSILYREIKKEKEEFDILKTQIGMLLQKTMNTIKQTTAKPDVEQQADADRPNKRPGLFAVEHPIINNEQPHPMLEMEKPRATA